MSPSFKVELARFSARWRIQDGARCGNIVGVLVDPRNLPLNFGQDRVSNSLDTAEIEFVESGCAKSFSCYRIIES